LPPTIGGGKRIGRRASIAVCWAKPSAQGHLLETSADCLEGIEKSVNWEAEKLYGVEGQGPFDEF
jgi:hypothetical protein